MTSPLLELFPLSLELPELSEELPLELSLPEEAEELLGVDPESELEFELELLPELLPPSELLELLEPDAPVVVVGVCAGAAGFGAGFTETVSFVSFTASFPAVSDTV